jgi:pilus assembly protein CpaE
VVIGRVNDVELYRELMRRGASEYLVAPVNPLHLIEVISGLYLDPQAAPIGRVVAFVSARGGVGASTLAHNTAWCVAEGLKINTTLIDLDLPHGTAGLNFNEETGQGVADALSAPERLDDVLLDRLLIKRGEHLSLFTAPAVLERDYEAAHDAYESVIDAVRQSTPCVIVDLPATWSPWIRQTLIGCDDIVIVAAPDLASLRNAKNIMDILKGARANDAPPKLVLNQMGLPKRPEIPAKDFSDTMGVPPSLIIPFDAALFGTAANNGQMLLEVQPKSAVADSIRKLAEIVTGRAPQIETNKGALSSLLKGLKRA